MISSQLTLYSLIVMLMLILQDSQRWSWCKPYKRQVSAQLHYFSWQSTYCMALTASVRSFSQYSWEWIFKSIAGTSEGTCCHYSCKGLQGQQWSLLVGYKPMYYPSHKVLPCQVAFLLECSP
jgi:hypothetical protein